MNKEKVILLSKRRVSTQILFDILKVIRNKYYVGMIKSQCIYKANLSSESIRRYENLLIKNKFVKIEKFSQSDKIRTYYFITDYGLKALSDYENILSKIDYE